MIRFLKPSFWFDAYPLPFHQTSLRIIIGVFLAGIIFSIICLGLKKKFKDNKLALKVWKKLSNFGFTFGIVGLILVFLKQQRAPYIGMRIWMAVWVLFCLGWLVFIFKFIFIEVPGLRKEEEAQKQKEKYIP